MNKNCLMDCGILFFTLIILTLMDVSSCIPSKARLSCENKTAEKLYPVVLSGCIFYFSCQKSINRGLVPVPHPCPPSLLFDFKIQTCVVPNDNYECREENIEERCKAKCDCKLCYCHESLCESDCDDYYKRWCRGRRSRSPEIPAPQNSSNEAIPIFINATFECSDKYAGVYYSDPQFDCRVFHTCVQKRLGGPIHRKSKLCPGETAFDQIKLSCRPMGSFNCKSVTKWYFLRSTSFEKPSVPAKIAAFNRLPIEDKPSFSFTEVVAHSDTYSSKPTKRPTTSSVVSGPPNFPAIPIISTINPSIQHSLESLELKGQLPSCSYYRCCPGFCPPCHDICPHGPCRDNWCDNYFDLSNEDLSAYISPEVNDFQDHILYFGETSPVTDDLSVRSPSVVRRDTCEGKVHGGIYANMTSNCKSYYSCTDGTTREKLIEHTTYCPKGTYFNQKTRFCDWKLNFPCVESNLYF